VARELASKGVLLNAVCPGPTNTPMMASVLGEGEQAVKWKDAMVRGIPLKRMGEPDDYAGIVAFLASDDAGFMTGQTISVAGGMNMI
jgi:2-hydroxycyclohexanecarboxyl-CoA dehydrogenase